MKENNTYTPWIFGGFITLLLLIYIIRLMVLQTIDNQYQDSASSNVLRFVTQYPARGLIYDRNNKLMVYNEPVYDIMIVPRQVSAFDTADLCSILRITPVKAKNLIGSAKRYSRFKPSIFLKQVSNIDYAKFVEKSFKFPGFYAQTRTVRKYPQQNSAHLLGYVGEVTERQTKEEEYYKSGDYIGVNGLEKAYESTLRGEKGLEVYMVDVHNRIKGRFNDGKEDKHASPGQDIQITIDAELQAYGEQLMQNKIGAIIAIEPSSGEILSMVSAPGFDPNLLSGRERGSNYGLLNRDTLKPLFNRALQAQYPPGSTFKIINALIGLQLGVVNINTAYPCYSGYQVGRFFLGCHYHKSPLKLIESISNSCNAYYCHVYRNILDKDGLAYFRNNYMLWHNLTNSFGLGKKLGLDFPFELPGLVPDTSYYDRKIGNKRWVSLNIVSNAIGQGEILTTPLQMANMTCAIANKGYYIIPHFVKGIENQEKIDIKYRTQRFTKIEPIHFDPVIEGMFMAVNGESGTTARIARINDIEVCGKTGTAENPHGKPHSIFIAFAPRENPKIAVAIYVENAGYGSTWSAPIASLIIEKYINGSVDKSRTWLENRILNADLINVQATTH
ncbi:MAG: penicillin-binding protein 2 [Salinivirgaceae bacterium]|nr:penicillin-binding protein 2 [Salinivirgaceae bacterium]